MAIPVHRHTDICTGHGCFPPRPNAQASSDVIVNNLGWHRQSDSWMPHCCVTCHGGNLVSGSPNVFVNNFQAARMGDPVSCGSRAMTHSPDVFAN